MHDDEGEVALESFIYFLQTTFATELRGGRSWKMEFMAFSAVPTNHHQLPLTYFHSYFCFLQFQCSSALQDGIVSIWLYC